MIKRKRKPRQKKSTAIEAQDPENLSSYGSMIDSYGSYSDYEGSESEEDIEILDDDEEGSAAEENKGDDSVD